MYPNQVIDYKALRGDTSDNIPGIKGIGEKTAKSLIQEYGNKDEFNKFDIAIPIGLSYEFKFPLVIDLRYNIGLTKVNKNDTPDGKDYQNMQAALTLGYKFKL